MTTQRIWHNLLDSIIKTGRVINPRDMETLEIVANTTIIDMRRPILIDPLRKPNYKFMLGEAFWILSGSNKVKDVEPYMKAITKFSDNGIMFRGAYGPKVIEQLDYVVDTLVKDPNSRQAIMTIWRENPRESKDIPCTIALQFLIRNGRLQCIATMRSSDAWLGWVYDTFNFSMIAAWVGIHYNQAKRSGQGNVLLGNLHLTAGSQHLYADNLEKAVDLLNAHENSDLPRSANQLPLDLTTFNNPEKFLASLHTAATFYGRESKESSLYSGTEFFNQFSKL